jgi:hypothetical protein
MGALLITIAAMLIASFFCCRWLCRAARELEAGVAAADKVIALLEPAVADEPAVTGEACRPLAETLPGALAEIEAGVVDVAEEAAAAAAAAEPCQLTDKARQALTGLLQMAPSFCERAAGNGRRLADGLRAGSPHPDVAIAGYVLALLDWAGETEYLHPDPVERYWELVEALAAAAIDLTAWDRVP